LRVNPAAEATIGAGDDVLAPDHPGEVEDAVGDDLRVLDDVGGVADDARDQDFSVGQLDVSPDFPLVLVTDVAGLDRVSTNANLKQDVDDVPKRQVGGMRPVPAAPADVIADPILGQTTEGVVVKWTPFVRQPEPRLKV
jgi:hypothetical protein